MFYLLANAIFLFLRGLERLLMDSDPGAARLVGRSALVGAGGMLLLGMVSSLFALSGHSWFR